MSAPDKPARHEVGAERDPRLKAWFAASRPISRDDMLGRVFRFGEMPHSGRAFLDAAIPGHNRVLMGALGTGTADQDLAKQVETAEHYHIDYIRAEPGNGAALHSHDSEETFICLTGRWRVSWGDRGEESVELGYLDGICCPPGVMRSFENLSGETALMMAILGGRKPGHVVWARSIRDKMTAAHGA